MSPRFPRCHPYLEGADDGISTDGPGVENLWGWGQSQRPPRCHHPQGAIDPDLDVDGHCCQLSGRQVEMLRKHLKMGKAMSALEMDEGTAAGPCPQGHLIVVGVVPSTDPAPEAMLADEDRHHRFDGTALQLVALEDPDPHLWDTAMW